MLQAEAHLRIVFGIALFERGTNRVQVGNRLRWSDSRLHVSKHLANPTTSARFQEIRCVVLLLVDDGHKKIGREDQHSPAKPGRGYTDDGIRMAVETENPAHDATTVLKMGVPIRVGKHDMRSTLVGGVNEAAQVGLNA